MLASLPALLSTACLVVTLHPVYEPETIAFDAALVGTWVSADEERASTAEPVLGPTLTFERGEWHSYHLLVEGGRERFRASARLTRAGDRLLLDVSPLDGTDIPALVLPVHILYRVVVDGDALTLSGLDYDLLEAQLRQGDLGVAAVMDARRNVVITAGTAELRQWIASRSEENDAFGAPAIFKRKEADSAPEVAQ